MQYRAFGRTGIQISAVSFGAGPVSALMVGDDVARQHEVIAHAIDLGINWFDTAATYGAGRSELNLGRVLKELEAASRVHVATKVRLAPEDLSDMRGALRRSCEESLKRLQLSSVTFLQLHNSITLQRGDEPTSVTPADVLGSGGVADAFDELRAEGLALHLGLSGLGHPGSLVEVIRSGRFEGVQTPYNLLNPSAGRDVPARFAETNYGNIISKCAQMDVGVLAIRVFAGGALADRSPSPHTYKTAFFPLDLYQRDRRRAAHLQQVVGSARQLRREAVRFALSHPGVQSALIGFSDTAEIDEVLDALTPRPSLVEWSELWNRELDAETGQSSLAR
jgi:aryl-alcohol dehydrogenase-like predicted oxidoreductase